jgi:hypothetical protein
MGKLAVIILFSILIVGCSSVNSSNATPAIAAIGGSWNLVLTSTQSGYPPAGTFGFGLSIAQSGSVATATQIPLTVPTTYGLSCPDATAPVTISGLSAQQATITIAGNTNGNSDRPEIMTDTSCAVVANLTVTGASMAGTYTFSGSSGQTTGSVAMTRQ